VKTHQRPSPTMRGAKPYPRPFILGHDSRIEPVRLVSRSNAASHKVEVVNSTRTSGEYEGRDSIQASAECYCTSSKASPPTGRIDAYALLRALFALWHLLIGGCLQCESLPLMLIW
jgi:hypothetical protein